MKIFMAVLLVLVLVNSQAEAGRSGGGRSYSSTRTINRNTTVTHEHYHYGSGGGGFFSGYLWGSMMSHPYGGYYGGYSQPVIVQQSQPIIQQSPDGTTQTVIQQPVVVRSDGGDLAIAILAVICLMIFMAVAVSFF